jgi:hypothetical protein
MAKGSPLPRFQLSAQTNGNALVGCAKLDQLIIKGFQPLDFIISDRLIEKPLAEVVTNWPPAIALGM